ncbi:MAG: hypothetical protein H0U79_05945 [Solirubrobacterales bacterium]|nr:hypothetical protein [Solirubrobacterales bacterium]
MSTSNDRHGIPSTASDLELLRAFEPVVRFTAGEQFFPMDVERYVRSCSLWLYHSDDHDEQVVPEGELTLEMLREPRAATFGAVLYLRFVPPLGIEDSARALADLARLRRKQAYTFRTGLGRLARGGLVPRLIDAVFSATLLLRGRVPKATAAVAVLEYTRLQEQEERFVYHGRVVRDEGWTVCQYWLFFAYNNWRSGFHGVNDHESDWELVNVYLYERDGELVPEWAGYASHDFHGADLRRRWDDRADLELDGAHPVVFAAAGSHASYFRAGEYQADVPLPTPPRMREAIDRVGKFWRRTLGQAGGRDSPFRAPFIDFARGDGLSVGPGREREWTPVEISEATPWAAEYRGLWGFYAQDPISGEDAPAGPMYNRDGSPRAAWFDPLGFAGLDQLPPPPVELEVLTAEVGTLNGRQGELAEEITREAAELQRLGLRLESMEGNSHLAAQHRRLAAEVSTLASRVQGLRRERSENAAVLESLERRLVRLRSGQRDDARAHIGNAAEPVPPAEMRFGRVAELWAALSLSTLLIGVVALIQFAPADALAGVFVLMIALVVSESILRATFVRTINLVAVVLALIAAVILLLHFWKPIVMGAVLALAAFLLWQRVRELRA